jgi:hypothetical protein
VTVAGLVALAGAGHVLYPAWLAWATHRRRDLETVLAGDKSTSGDREPWPPLTVLVPAFREAGVIVAKIEDLRANGYPGPLEVLVIADGDPDTAAAAERAGAKALTSPDRLGKSQALNRGFAAAKTAIVVISDANNRLVLGALAALVRHFEDPEVGAVAGEKIEDDGGGEGIYWRFESWLKKREDALGTTIGLVGELSAFRAEAWRPIPPDIAIDDLWAALDITEQGYRIAYEPEAKAIDPPVGSLTVQWERRTRNIAGALHVFARRRRQLRPSAGLVAAEIWGHRLVRSTLGPLAHVGLLGIALRRVRSSRIARLFLLGHLLAAAALLWTATQSVEGHSGTDQEVRRSPRVLVTATAAAGQVLFLQAVALGGLLRYLRGDRRTTWSTVDR